MGSAKSPEVEVISNYLPSKPSGYLALPEAGTYPFLSGQSCLEAQCLTQGVSLLQGPEADFRLSSWGSLCSGLSLPGQCDGQKTAPELGAENIICYLKK